LEIRQTIQRILLLPLSLLATTQHLQIRLHQALAPLVLLLLLLRLLPLVLEMPTNRQLLDQILIPHFLSVINHPLHKRLQDSLVAVSQVLLEPPLYNNLSWNSH
jgi:hypothetical protein